MIRKRASRTGDGSHNSVKNSELSKKSDDEVLMEYVLKQCIDENGNMINNNEELVWGYEDALLSDEDKKCIKILKHQED